MNKHFQGLFHKDLEAIHTPSMKAFKSTGNTEVVANVVKSVGLLRKENNKSTNIKTLYLYVTMKFSSKT